MKKLIALVMIAGALHAQDSTRARLLKKYDEDKAKLIEQIRNAENQEKEWHDKAVAFRAALETINFYYNELAKDEKTYVLPDRKK